MKNFLLPLFFMAMLSCNRDKQTNGSNPESVADTVHLKEEIKDTPVKESDPILSIRKKTEWINTAILEKKHFEFMCDEKMTVDYFYSNGEIVKVAVNFGTVGDVYAKEGYYYDKGRLIFIYEFVEGGPACEGCIKTNEYRTYISNDKTIRYLKDKTEEICKKCEFGPSSRQYKLLRATTLGEVRALFCP